MIGIITAMQCEAGVFKTAMTQTSCEKIGHTSYIQGLIGSTEVVLSVCGVGKVFAGVCAHTMIVSFGCTHIFNIGVAGSLDDRISINDIVSATAAVQHDMDTSAVGDPVGMISGINVISLPCDDSFSQHFAKYLSDNGKGDLKMGIVATGDRFFKTNAERQAIASAFDAIVGEMEGGAVGQICYANGVAYNIVRIITDKAGDDSGREYAANRDECAVELAQTFIGFLKSR